MWLTAKGAQQLRAYNLEVNKKMAATAGNPPCPECSKPLAKFEVKKADSPNVGRDFYTCNPCKDKGTKVFIWTDEYGKDPEEQPKKAWAGFKRKATAPPPAATRPEKDEENERWKLRMEEKVDRLLKIIQEAQDAQDQ